MGPGQARESEIVEPLAFKFRLADGSGLLQLGSQRFFGWLTVEDLQLDVPRLSMPVDVSAGPERFQRRRTETRRASLRVAADDLRQFAAKAELALAPLGVEEIRLGVQAEGLNLAARMNRGRESFDVTARIFVSARGPLLRFSAAHPRTIGFASTPAPLLVHQLLSALLHESDSQQRERVVARGLVDFELRPLDALLSRVLPAAGWRIPLTRGQVATVVAADGDELRIEFAAGEETTIASEAASLAIADLDRYRTADELLLGGDITEALRAYESELAALGGERPFLIERILAITSASRDHFDAGIELARRVLGRWPDFAAAHGAMASIASAQADTESAIEHLQTLSEVSAALGDEEGAARAALASARMLRETSSEQATSVFEEVLARRPDSPEAVEALAERYRVEERWDDLVTLLRKRLQNIDDPMQRAREHLRLARVLLEEIGDAERARAEANAAAEFDPQSAAALELLAEVELAQSEKKQAYSLFVSASARYRAMGDSASRLRTLIIAGELALDLKDAVAAEECFEAILGADPGNERALRGIAGAAASLGDVKRAADTWSELIAAGVESPKLRAEYSLELGRNLIATGDSRRAREALERAMETGAEEVVAEACSLLVPLVLIDGDNEHATAFLDQAAQTLAKIDPARAADLTVQRAEIARSTGASEEVLADYRRAFAIAEPGSDAHTAAAKALLEGEDSPELEWIDALIANATSVDERASLQLRRADFHAVQGDVPGAIADIDAALDTVVDTSLRSRVLAAKGDILMRAGNAVGRAEAISERAALEGNVAARSTLLCEAAEAWLEAGSIERALNSAREAVASGQPAASEAALRARLALGACGWRLREWEIVEEAYGSIPADARPRETTVHLGQALIKQGKDEEALDLLEEIALEETDELSPTIWRMLGDLHERSQRHLEAAMAWRSCAETSGDEDDSTTADAWYRAGDLYRKAGGQSEEAIRCLNKALDLHSDLMPALDSLESIATESQDLERLAVILGRKVAATSRHPQRQKALLVRLAELRIGLGDSEAAAQTVVRALEIDDHYRPALRLRAHLLREHGDLAAAQDVLALLATELPGDNPAEIEDERRHAARELGNLLKKTAGDASPQAVAALEADLDSAPQAEVLVGLEAVYRRRADRAAVADILGRRAALEEGVRSLPLDLERILILGEELEDPGATLLAVRAALRRNPDSPPLLKALERWQAETDDAMLESETSSAAEHAQEDEEEITQPGDPRDRAGHFTEEASAALAELDAGWDTEALAFAGGHLQDPYSDLLSKAQEKAEAGDWSEATELLADVDLDRAPRELLRIYADALEGRHDYVGASDVLQRMLAQARREENASDEHRLCRRLGDLLLEHRDDELGALSLFHRALELRPDDLVAAEITADLTSRHEPEKAQAAWERVLELVRSSGIGAREEARALRELAKVVRRSGEVERASSLLDQACELAPGDLEVINERAEIAIADGDYETAARWLESLAGELSSTNQGSELRSGTLGDLLLQLADLYYDRLEDPARARVAMRKAADAFGRGSRRDATLRLLATEAVAGSAFTDAAEAFEAIGTDALAATDLVTLAKVYQRLGRDQAAIDVLETARRSSTLPDDGAMLLFSLHRQSKRKAELAASLEAGAAGAPPAVATTRLLEALKIYEESLGDHHAAERIRERLMRLSPQPGAERAVSTVADLESAAGDAARANDLEVAADLLCRAIVHHARELNDIGSALDDTLDTLLSKLRDVCRKHLPDAEPPARRFESLASGLAAAAAVEGDSERAAELLREAAAVRRAHLGDTRGAADALARALALTPGDVALLRELDTTLRETADFPQIVSAHELHLSSVEGSARFDSLLELARLHHEIFGDSGRARRYLLEARETDPERGSEVEPLLAELPPSPGEHPPVEREEQEPLDRIEEELRRAADLEARGQIEAAVAHYEDAARQAPGDTRPLRSLERLHQMTQDSAALCDVLERLAAATEDRQARAILADRRAKIFLEDLRREADAYVALKEAFANDPDNSAVASRLRSIAMARGEWALSAELVYREIAKAENPIERGALFLELAMIYDEKLLDAEQAVVNYEQALALDPNSPAAPQPLARLYELAGKADRASAMYELAAVRTRAAGERGTLLRQAATCAQRAGLAEQARRLFSLAAMTAEGKDREAAEAALAEMDANPRFEEARTSRDRRPTEVKQSGPPVAAYLAGSPRDADAFERAREAAYEAKDYQALASVLEARAGSLDDPGARIPLYFELGHIQQRELSDINAAEGSYERVIADDPAHLGALEGLAEIAYRRGDWLKARKYHQLLTPERSTIAASQLAFRRGEIAEALGREDEAYQAFRTAVDEEPDNAKALLAFSRTALRVGDVQQAVKAHQSLIDLIPPERVEELRNARLQLADLCERAGETAQAIYYLEMVLADAPSSITALSRLVTLYQTRQDPVGASRVLKNLIALTAPPVQRADLFYRLGEVHRKSDDIEQAADAYLKAVDLDPDHVPALRHLIGYYWRNGEPDSLLDVARDLESRAELLARETGIIALGRCALIAALDKDSVMAHSICRYLAADAAAALGAACVEAPRLGKDTEAIATAAHSALEGQNIAALIDWIESEPTPERQELAAALRAF